MKLLIVNLILYTPEKGRIPRVDSIKDTMIYDLCLAGVKEGHEVTLYAADAYRPIQNEQYPFKIVWGICKCSKIFKPTALPYTPDLKKYMREHGAEYDLIISSEVFSMASWILTRTANNKLIVWHELAKHNRMMHKIPSKVWYNVIARFFFRKTCVVARSVEAREFIRQYCPDTQEQVIDHGVNLDLFQPITRKKNYFVVCSQLIPRKQIDGIILQFGKFVEKGHNDFKLYIIGEGEEETTLKTLVKNRNLEKQVLFTGKLTHQDMIPYLAEAKGLLINTRQDNNMISIVEAIAVGTPILTTSVPNNASYIRKEELGIVQDQWTESDLEQLIQNNSEYTENCMKYRMKLSTQYRIRQFVEIGQKEQIKYENSDSK